MTCILLIMFHSRLHSQTIPSGSRRLKVDTIDVLFCQVGTISRETFPFYGDANRADLPSQEVQEAKYRMMAVPGVSPAIRNRLKA